MSGYASANRREDYPRSILHDDVALGVSHPVANFAAVSSELLMMATGTRPMMAWDGQSAQMRKAGVEAPATACVIEQPASSPSGDVSGGPYKAFVRFIDRGGRESALSPVSNEVTYSDGRQVVYKNVPVPIETDQIVKVQILRNTTGQSQTFYIDIDSTNITAGTFTSNKTVDELEEEESVSVFDEDGELLYKRDRPPDHKPILAVHQSRVYAAGCVEFDAGYVEVTNGETLIRGVGVEFPLSMAGRYIYIEGNTVPYLVTAIEWAELDDFPTVVNKLFTILLERSATQAEKDLYTAVYEDEGKTFEEVVGRIVALNEFQVLSGTKYPTDAGDRSWVIWLYEATHGLVPTEAHIQHWLGELHSSGVNKLATGCMTFELAESRKKLHFSGVNKLATGTRFAEQSRFRLRFLGRFTGLRLAEAYQGPTMKAARYVIRVENEQVRAVWYSEPGLPEAWDSRNVFTPEETGDQPTALISHESYLYVVESMRTHRLATQGDPLEGHISLLFRRGCVNSRCWIIADGSLFLMDYQGVYRVSGNMAESVSDTVQDWFRDRINWKYAEYFHAVFDPVNEVSRWFVVLGSQPPPSSCLCLAHRSGRWWIETFPVKVGTSTTSLSSPFRGNQPWIITGGGQRYLRMNIGNLDGVPSTVTTSGTVTSTGLLFLSDSRAAFGEVLTGLTVSIVSGRGMGQARDISSVSADGKTIILSTPWSILPDTTSKYQIGGIDWRWVSKPYRWAVRRDEQEERRAVRLFYDPTASGVSHMRLVRDRRLAGEPAAWSLGGYSDKASREDEPEMEVLLDATDGVSAFHMDQFRDPDTAGPRLITLDITGHGGGEPFIIHGIDVDGVEGE